MKVIDIINKIADGTLEDGFRFKIRNSYNTFVYSKEGNIIYCENGYEDFWEEYCIESILNDEVEVIKESKEIEELDTTKTFDSTMQDVFEWNNEMEEKINELVRAVNKINKEMEEKQ